MKVIGITGGRDEFIITASLNELAKVCGFAYPRSIHNECPEIAVGSILSVAKIFERLKALEGAAKELTAARITLRAVAELLEPISPAIDAAQEKGEAL